MHNYTTTAPLMANPPREHFCVTWLVDPELYDQPRVREHYREEAAVMMRRMARGVRWPPEAERPFELLVNDQPVGHFEALGDTQRDRWRSIVVQFEALRGIPMREDSQYNIQYMAWILCFDCYLRFIPIDPS